MLQVYGLKKSFSARVLFEDVSFTIGKKEIVGLVGRNGCGKTTLLKILLSKETADNGEISIPKSYTLGYLDQHISFTEKTLIEECMKVLPRELQYETYRAEKILSGLGFQTEDFEKPPGIFSGGFQLRINLTKCLLQEPNLLLLDEPTNYLDILSLNWMKTFLRNFSGEVLLITHDRSFMDDVVTHTMGIHRQKLRKIKGDTTKYYEQISADEEIYEKTRLNQEKKIKHMQNFVEKFRAKASKATQAQSVLKKIEKLKVLNILDEESFLGFQFHYEETPAKRLLNVSQLSFAFPNQPELFTNLNFEGKPGQCIAIIGKNGKGKSTLLNLLANEIAISGSQQNGQVEWHPSTKLGYYQQTHRKNLNLNWTIIDEIASADPKLETTRVRGICGAMMFSGKDAEKKINVLSGGEKARVLLGKVIAKPCNILFLDEPSNHLDMESIEAMTQEISNFPGLCLIVTHNEEMLRDLATQLIIFKNENAEFFNGTYEEFLEKAGWDHELKKSVTSSHHQNIEANTNISPKKEDRHQRALRVQNRSKELKPILQKIKIFEDKISLLDKELAILNDQVTQMILENANGSEIQNLYKEIGQKQIQIETIYSELEPLLEKQEEIEEKYR